MSNDPLPLPPSLHDFALLPRRRDGNLAVYPTTVRVLEQHGNYLVYHSTKGVLSEKKHKILQRLVGDDGLTTVLVVQGDPDGERSMLVYDRTWEERSPVWFLATDADIRGYIRDWFASVT